MSHGGILLAVEAEPHCRVVFSMPGAGEKSLLQHGRFSSLSLLWPINKRLAPNATMVDVTFLSAPMKTSQPKFNRRATAWLRAAMKAPPMSVETHTALQRRQTSTRRALEDLREQRAADPDRWT
jgi:hypothetical protein